MSEPSNGSSSVLVTPPKRRSCTRFIIVLSVLVPILTVAIGGSVRLWRQTSVHRPWAQMPLPITLLLIDKSTPQTLRHSLESYKRAGLHLMVEDALLYVQQLPQYSMDELNRTLADYPFISLVLGSPNNTWVHGATAALVRAARTRYVLLLEKDFELIESTNVTLTRLREAVGWLRSGRVTVVRMKSRVSPGVPEFARLAWQYKESAMLSEWPALDLACQLMYWMNDSQLETIYRNHSVPISKCGLGHERYWCAPARWCHWTNQAALFDRQWFIDSEMVDLAERLSREDRGSFYQNHHAFEIACRWNTSAPWLGKRGHRVALGAGLFRHNDLDRYPFNTSLLDAARKRFGSTKRSDA